MGKHCNILHGWLCFHNPAPYIIWTVLKKRKENAWKKNLNFEWVSYWMTTQAFTLILPVISWSHKQLVFTKKHCIYTEGFLSRLVWVVNILKVTTSTSKLHSEALLKANLAFPCGMCGMCCMAPASALNQSAEVLWSHRTSRLIMNLKRTHQLCSFL